jgi:hypothetical protein
MDKIIQGKNGILRKKSKILYPLIIKGLMSEPNKLNAVKVENSFIVVLGRNRKTQIRLKAQYGYKYDNILYQKLQNAYETKDKKELEKLWQQAEPIAIS